MDQMTFPIQGKTSMTPEDVKNMFYEQIEQDTRFDRGIHDQYMGMEVSFTTHDTPTYTVKLTP